MRAGRRRSKCVLLRSFALSNSGHERGPCRCPHPILFAARGVVHYWPPVPILDRGPTITNLPNALDQRGASVASRAGLARFALLHRPSHVIAEHRAPWPRCSHADGRPPLRPSHHVRLPKRLDALANQQHAGGRRYRWIALDAESCWIAHVTHTHAKNAPRSDPERPRGLHTQHIRWHSSRSSRLCAPHALLTRLLVVRCNYVWPRHSSPLA